MKRLLLAAVLLLPFALPLPAFAQDEGHAGAFKGELPDTGGIDAKFDPRVVAITSKLGCNCGTCPHEPVNVCNCGTAARVRAEVAARISKGQDEPTIMAGIIDTFGDSILPRPPLTPFNSIAYLASFVAMGGVGVWIWRVLKRGPSKTALEPSPKTAAAHGKAEDAYLAQVDAELAKER